jgi:hypothetical protein
MIGLAASDQPNLTAHTWALALKNCIWASFDTLDCDGSRQTHGAHARPLKTWERSV